MGKQKEGGEVTASGSWEESAVLPMVVAQTSETGAGGTSEGLEHG